MVKKPDVRRQYLDGYGQVSTDQIIAFSAAVEKAKNAFFELRDGFGDHIASEFLRRMMDTLPPERSKHPIRSATVKNDPKLVSFLDDADLRSAPKVADAFLQHHADAYLPSQRGGLVKAIHRNRSEAQAVGSMDNLRIKRALEELVPEIKDEYPEIAIAMTRIASLFPKRAVSENAQESSVLEFVYGVFSNDKHWSDQTHTCFVIRNLLADKLSVLGFRGTAPKAAEDDPGSEISTT